MRVLLTAAALLLTVAGAQAQPSRAPWMIGLWYGEGYQPVLKQRAQWLTERRADGTLTVEFRHYDDCKLTYRSVETGSWMADDVNYVSHIQTINGQPVDIQNVYRITKHTDVDMDYLWVQGNVSFHSTKVDPTFRMPACLTS